MSSQNQSTVLPGNIIFDEYDYGINGLFYTLFPFEKPIFLFIWEILVIIVFLLNIPVVLVLLRKQMRNPINTVLVSIAIADSLTGLVTLPSYIAVYSKDVPVPGDYSDEDYYQYEWTTEMTQLNTTEADESDPAVIVSRQLCQLFMISKFFISHSFHTASIWLTLFLGAQRFVYVTFPLRARTLFTIRKSTLICVAIFAFSPILHLFHLFDDKAKSIGCQWDKELDRCGPGCIYIIVMFIFKHFVPTVLLSVLTIMFIRNLLQRTKHVAEDLTEGDSQQSALRKRENNSRRISKIVTAVLVMFLIPEVPFGIFYLFSIISWRTNVQLSLESNRIFQASYEILMLVSFGANFCIYTVLNERFRKELKNMCRCVTKRNVLTISKSESTSKSPKTVASSVL